VLLLTFDLLCCHPYLAAIQVLDQVHVDGRINPKVVIHLPEIAVAQPVGELCFKLQTPGKPFGQFCSTN